MNIYEEIQAERERQIAKGYFAEHDDMHDGGELATIAALVLFEDAGGQIDDESPEATANYIMRRHTRREQLIIALALGVAEIERLDRKEKA